ncbi:hypothetical protein GLYMA_12G151566v4 [Glycine max]|nr:hypothetical protein GLYMA_12G151566v4 [Glycine max]KAH1143295.1 hypothetical protein GYH30_033822 [Glycine max]
MIMRCVLIVTFSVLINGEPYRDFHLYRGLRQGDCPLTSSFCVQILC